MKFGDLGLNFPKKRYNNEKKNINREAKFKHLESRFLCRERENYMDVGETQNNKIKLNNISLYKCIMLFLVIFGHCCIVFNGNNWGGISKKGESTLWIWEITNWLSTFHTYAFVFASGFLFSYGRYSQGKYKAGKRDLRKRVQRLLVPYIVISIIWAMPIDKLLLGMGVKQLLKNYILVLSAAQLWFLVMLFNVWLFFYIMSDFIIKLSSIVGIIGFICLRFFCVWCEQKGLPVGVLGISNSMRYALLFYLGMLSVCRSVKKDRYRLWVKCVLLLLAEICVYILYKHYMDFSLNAYLKEFLFIATNVNGVFLSWSVVNCFDCDRLVNHKCFTYIYQCSMGIYLLHQQLLYISMRIFNISWIHPIMFIMLNFIIVIIVSFIMVYYARKTKLGRIILGG